MILIAAMFQYGDNIPERVVALISHNRPARGGHYAQIQDGQRCYDLVYMHPCGYGLENLSETQTRTIDNNKSILL